ncbi:cysteine-rich CWC family protein, partial [Aeromonas sp. CPF2-S1]|nr:cysteine-rich CWC family protein [Aeromonas sp. CPF2-S1]
LDGSKSTHACPGCGEPAFCAVSAGEPIERCWCNQLPALPMSDASACWCRRCLAKAIAARP